jgi:hypothetical protein
MPEGPDHKETRRQQIEMARKVWRSAQAEAERRLAAGEITAAGFDEFMEEYNSRMEGLNREEENLDRSAND